MLKFKIVFALAKALYEKAKAWFLAYLAKNHS
jgi:hypothetical protein